MEMKSSFVNRSGQKLQYTYNDIDSFSALEGKKVRGVHAFCFCGDKLVIVYSDAKGYWTPPINGKRGGKRGQAQFMHDMMSAWHDPLALTSETFRDIYSQS